MLILLCVAVVNAKATEAGGGVLRVAKIQRREGGAENGGGSGLRHCSDFLQWRFRRHATEDIALSTVTVIFFFFWVAEALSEAIERVESKLAERRAIRERKKTLHLFLSVAHSVDKIEMLLVLPPMGGPFAL